MKTHIIRNTLFARGLTNALSVLLIVFCSLGNASSQLRNLHQYTIDDGLASNSVYGAMQDSEGFIWIYTEIELQNFVC